MSFIKLPEKSELSGKTLELIEETEKRWGYIPNISRAYSLAPHIMEAENIWSGNVIYKGLLPRKLKEAIATVVSATNDCDYCASSHAHAYTLAGGDVEQARSCKSLDFHNFDAKERTALEFTRKAAGNPKSVKQEDIDGLQQHFSTPEIIEIATVIQQFMGYNWFVTMLGLELEEANPMGAGA